MQLQIGLETMIVIVVVLLLVFGPERAVGFGRDLQKAWTDFVGIFRR